MRSRQSMFLAIIFLASSLLVAAQSDKTRKDQSQNQTTGAATPDPSKAQSGGTGMGTPSSTPQSDRGISQKAQDRIIKEVRHELVMLPNLSLWDNLAYKVDGYKVTLLGQVRNASLKSEAENAVKHIEGVEQVDN